MQGTRTRSFAAVVGALALVCASCSGGGATRRVAAVHRHLRRSTTTSSSTTSTTAGGHAAAAPLPGLGRGSTGPAVLDLETKLAALKYDPGRVDGVFDSTTQFAVIAFQKVMGMARSGRATDDVIAALATAGEPAAMLPAGGATRVEVDLKRQVLFLYQGGSLSRILPVSTGSGRRYCVDGQCDVAVTPGGSFRVGLKILGPHTSKLGVLYNPLFFNGGIAIHGEPSVPSYPASHGCVRIPMADSLWFYNTVAKGTPVYVLGGPRAPVPFDTPAPDGTPPASAPATTTTVAPPPTSHPTTTLVPPPPSTTTTTTKKSTTTTTA